MTTTSSAASFIQRVLEPAEEQWLRAGGHTLVRNSSAPLPPVVQASRDAFALLQTAAAIDRESAQLRHDLCELDGGEDEGSRRVRPCVAPPSATGQPAVADDESDGDALQGSLVEAHVRAGKAETTIGAHEGVEHRAPDGSLRLIEAGVLSPDECTHLISGGLVAMAGAFSRCGQTTLGVSPALGSRLLALPAAGGDGGDGVAAKTAAECVPAALPMLYRVVERARRRVARAFGASLDELRVSDATFTRLQPVVDRLGERAGRAATVGGEGGGAPDEAIASGALDVGMLRADRFIYWRPHIDQVLRLGLTICLPNPNPDPNIDQVLGLSLTTCLALGLVLNPSLIAIAIAVITHSLAPRPRPR